MTSSSTSRSPRRSARRARRVAQRDRVGPQAVLLRPRQRRPAERPAGAGVQEQVGVAERRPQHRRGAAGRHPDAVDVDRVLDVVDRRPDRGPREAAPHVRVPRRNELCRRRTRSRRWAPAGRARLGASSAFGRFTTPNPVGRRSRGGRRALSRSTSASWPLWSLGRVDRPRPPRRPPSARRSSCPIDRGVGRAVAVEGDGRVQRDVLAGRGDVDRRVAVLNDAGASAC